MMMSSSWIRASALSPPQVQQITASPSYSFGCASPSASDLSSSSDSDRSSIVSTSTIAYSFGPSTSSSQYSTSLSHSHVTPPSSASRSSSSWFSYHGQSSSSYISDADLFPDELVDECPLLREAPAPPRILPMPIPASPSPAPLRPLYAPEKKSKRGKSPRKMLRPAGKRMSPIVE